MCADLVPTISCITGSGNCYFLEVIFLFHAKPQGNVFKSQKAQVERFPHGTASGLWCLLKCFHLYCGRSIFTAMHIV